MTGTEGKIATLPTGDAVAAARRLNRGNELRVVRRYRKRWSLPAAYWTKDMTDFGRRLVDCKPGQIRFLRLEILPTPKWLWPKLNSTLAPAAVGNRPVVDDSRPISSTSLVCLFVQNITELSLFDYYNLKKYRRFERLVVRR